MNKINRNNILLFILTVMIFNIVLVMPINAKNKYPNATSEKYVNDYANIIKNEDKQYIISLGKELEDKTSAQVSILTINSTDGENIDEYSHNVFQKWKLGQKEKNNGLLIIIAKNDKKWRVEVGTGLEGAVTDIDSNRIMQKYFVPEAKKNNYSNGIKNSYLELAKKIAREYNVNLNKSSKINKNYTKPRKKTFDIITTIIMFLIISSMFNGGNHKKTGKKHRKNSLFDFLLYNEIFNSNHSNNNNDDDHFGGFGDGGFGGFGGGNSSGGGSSGSW